MYNRQAKGESKMEFFEAHRFIIAQIIGFCAMGTAITSFQLKKRKQILIFQIICTAIWTLHFLILGVPTACAINGVQTIRCVIYYFKETQKWAQSKFWLWFFLIASVVLTILTWENFFNLFPMLGMMFSTISLWLKKPKHIRLMTLPVSAVWLVYGVVCKSYAGVCNETFVIISVLLALWRLDRKQK